MPPLDSNHPYLNFKDNFDRIPLCGSISNDHLRNELKNILTFYNNDTDVYAPQYIQNYVDHGVSHHRNVWIIVNRMVYDNQSLLTHFNDYEKYSLSCAIWVHDIGMSKNLAPIDERAEESTDENKFIGHFLERFNLNFNDIDLILKLDDDHIRKCHSLISEYFIEYPAEIKTEDGTAYLGVAIVKPGLRNIIGLICRFHQSQWKLEDCPEETNYDNTSIRTRCLSAILRLADSLDQSKIRGYRDGRVNVKSLINSHIRQIEKLSKNNTFVMSLVNQIKTGNVDDELLEKIQKFISTDFAEDTVNRKIANYFRKMYPSLKSIPHYTNKIVQDINFNDGKILIKYDNTTPLNDYEKAALNRYKNDIYTDINYCSPFIRGKSCKKDNSGLNIDKYATNYEGQFQEGNFSFEDLLLPTKKISLKETTSHTLKKDKKRREKHNVEAKYAIRPIVKNTKNGKKITISCPDIPLDHPTANDLGTATDLITRAKVTFENLKNTANLSAKITIENKYFIAKTRKNRKLLAKFSDDAGVTHPACEYIFELLKCRDSYNDIWKVETDARFSAGGGIPIIIHNGKMWILVIRRDQNAPNYPDFFTAATGISQPNVEDRPNKNEDPETTIIRDWIDPRRLILSEVAEEILLVDKKNSKWIRFFADAKKINWGNISENINERMDSDSIEKRKMWIQYWAENDYGEKNGYSLPQNRKEIRMGVNYHPLGEDILKIQWNGRGENGKALENRISPVLMVVDPKEAAIDIIGAVIIELNHIKLEDLIILCGESKPNPINIEEEIPINRYIYGFPVEEFIKLYSIDKNGNYTEIAKPDFVFHDGERVSSDYPQIHPKLTMTPVLLQGGFALLKNYGKILNEIRKNYGLNPLEKSLFKNIPKRLISDKDDLGLIQKCDCKKSIKLDKE